MHTIDVLSLMPRRATSLSRNQRRACTARDDPAVVQQAPYIDGGKGDIGVGLASAKRAA